MNKFYVTIPLTGYYEIEVEALDTEDAVERAFESVENWTDEGLVQLDGYHRITSGNVLHAPVNCAYAEPTV